MTKITGLTQNASQKFTISDPNGGGNISVTLTYRPRVRGWFIDFTFKTFILNGYKITRGPNILSKFRNVIPFGLAVTVSDNYEPFLINDFSSSRVSLFLLTTAEVDEVISLIAQGYTVP